MAKKTQASKSALHEHAALQEAIFSVGEAQAFAQASIFEAEDALRQIRDTQEALSQAKSHLRDLLKAQEHGRSPSRRPGEVSLGRKYVDGALQNRPRLDSRKPKGSLRKRLSRKPAGKEFFHDSELPH